MEWAALVYNAGVGIGVALIGLAVVVLVLVSIPLVRDTRRLVADARRLTGLAEAELRPTLAQLRAVTQTLERLASETPARLERLDALLTDAERTLGSVQAASDTVARYADIPGAGISTVANAVRRARDVFTRGRVRDAPVESGSETEDAGT